MSLLTNYYFWFAPPPLGLTSQDRLIGYCFAGLFVLAIVLMLTGKFISHPVVKKLLKKFEVIAWTLSLLGLFWVGLRFESTPVFADRYWAGLLAIIGIIWGLFAVKYFAFNFFPEKSEYNREEIKNRYIPGKK